MSENEFLIFNSISFAKDLLILLCWIFVMHVKWMESDGCLVVRWDNLKLQNFNLVKKQGC